MKAQEIKHTVKIEVVVVVTGGGVIVLVGVMVVFL
jgi:hypothetical protein